MTLKRPNPTALLSALLVPALVFALVPNRARAGDDTTAAIRSLDLTPPRQAPTGAWVQPPSGDTSRLPDPVGRSSRPGGAGIVPRGGRLRGDLPYGAGYEARQGSNGRGSGRGIGAGHGRGR